MIMCVSTFYCTLIRMTVIVLHDTSTSKATVIVVKCPKKHVWEKHTIIRRGGWGGAHMTEIKKINPQYVISILPPPLLRFFLLAYFTIIWTTIGTIFFLCHHIPPTYDLLDCS
jgi:hypothetical protein